MNRISAAVAAVLVAGSLALPTLVAARTPAEVATALFAAFEADTGPGRKDLLHLLVPRAGAAATPAGCDRADRLLRTTDDDTGREGALRVLEACPRRPDLLPRVTDLVRQGRDPALSGAPSRVLGRWATDVPEAVRILFDAAKRSGEYGVHGPAEGLSLLGEAAVSRLLDGLDDPLDAGERRARILGLVGMADGARRALDPLLRRVGRNGQPDLDERILEWAVAIDPQSAAIPAVFRRALDGETDPARRAALAGELAELCPRCEGTDRIVLEALGRRPVAWQIDFHVHEILPASDWPEAVRRIAPRFVSTDEDGADAAVALARLGPSGIEVLVRAARQGPGATRIPALQALADAGVDVPALRDVAIGMLEADPPTLAEAFTAIRLLARSPSPPLEVLSRTLATAREKSLRAEAAAALAGAGPAAVPALVAALDDRELDVHIAAVHALARIGPGALSAADALLKPARWTSDNEAALAAMGPAVVPKLATALASRERDVSYVAAMALARMEGACREVAPALKRALDAPNEWTRLWAARALGRAGVVSAVPALRSLTIDPAGSVRAEAADALRALGSAAAAAAPDLARLAADPFPYTGEKAIRALGVLGPPDLADLLAAALDPRRYWATRVEAANVARARAIRTPALLAALRIGLGDSNARVRLAAAEALLDLGDDGEVPLCLRVMEEAPMAAMREDADELRKNLRDLAPPAAGRPTGP